MECAPDHPVIHNLEMTGYPDGREPICPICPFCKEECEYIYFDLGGDIVGCDNCLKEKEAETVKECFPPENEDDDYYD